MGEELKLKKPYPLWKLEYEEIESRGEAVGTYNICVKIDKYSEWAEIYNTFSEPWAKIALKRLQEIFDIHIYKWLISENNNPMMFEVNDQVYKTTFVLPYQSCICGEQIAGNQRYGELAIGDIKFDYVRDLIFFYNSGTVLVKSNQVFLDGELIMTSKVLSDVCDMIGQSMSMLDSDPAKLIKYIKAQYDNVDEYVCNGYTAYNLQEQY